MARAESTLSRTPWRSSSARAFSLRRLAVVVARRSREMGCPRRAAGLSRREDGQRGRRGGPVGRARRAVSRSGRAGRRGGRAEGSNGRVSSIGARSTPITMHDNSVTVKYARCACSFEDTFGMKDSTCAPTKAR